MIEQKKVSRQRPQPLRQVLLEEGLTFRQISEMCPPEAKVNEQTVADIANGNRPGKEISRQRILNALNSYTSKKKTYSWEDLYHEAPKGRVSRLLEPLRNPE